MKTNPATWLGAAALGLVAGRAAAVPPPAEAFGRLPALQDARISPDGKHVATLGEGPGGKRVVSIAPIDARQTALLGMGDTVTRELRWAGDGNVLVRSSYYVVDPRWPKTPFHFNRWIAVDTSGKALGRLGVEGDMNDYVIDLPLLGVVEGAKPLAAMQGIDQTDVNDTYTSQSHFKTKIPTVTPAIYRVDVASGKTVGISERGNGNTIGWSVDMAGEARVRQDINETTHEYLLLGRRKGAGSWKELDRSDDADDAGSYLGYSDVDDAAYESVIGSDGLGFVQRYNLADGTTTALRPSQPVPFADIKWDEDRKAAVALTYATDHQAYDWLDKDLGVIHDKLARAFKGQDVELVNWSRDRTRFVVNVQSGDLPPTYYLLDSGQKSISPLGEAYPELKGAALGHRIWITYKARDGLEIPAYVTRPPGAPASGGKLPLVVMPHGGPEDRDGPGFDWWAQFVASRGYVVLQPQFRGSSGFGRTFQLAGRKEWSGKMQTDLLDGIDRLASDGTIDPKRVCIVGWSYGGYAALAGETLHPEAYRCAASVNGISDIGAFLNQHVRSGGGSFDTEDIRAMRRQLGWSSGATASPAKFAGDAGGPILLIHARQDTTVYHEQSEKMLAALRDKAKPAELITLEGDDHHLSDAASRIAMLKALDAFLARNLPVSR